MTKNIIGIIGAMSEEINPLLEIYGQHTSIRLGGNVFYTVEYQIDNKEAKIIIAYSKIGKVHAAITASSMILYFGVKKIIFSGVAGGLSSDLKVGDLLLATKLCQHDVDITAFGHALGFIPEGKLFYESDKNLVESAIKVAKKMGLKIKQGVVASGDQFIANIARKSEIARDFKAIAVEMEGASVACVCDNFNVPFCIFRSISDSADGDADISFDEFLESSAKISAKFVAGLIRELML